MKVTMSRESCRRHLSRLGCLLFAGLVPTGSAFAQTAERVEAVLSRIDAILAPTKAKRVDAKASPTTAMGLSLCEDLETEPGAANRDFLCNRTTPVGRWTLENLRADGGARVSASLEIRSFASKEQAQESKTIALARYGRGDVSIFEGAISWCFLDVFWTDELVFSLWYGCSISLPHVKALGAVRTELLRASEPFAQTGVVGVAGSHSGWSSLIDEQGGKHAPLPDGVRFRHFVKVTNVAADDVLWLRERPQSRALGAKLDKIPATASCLPLVFVPPSRPAGQAEGWAMVKFKGREGWVNRRYIAEQAAEECSRE